MQWTSWPSRSAQHQEAAQQKFGLPRFAPLTVSAVQRVCARVVADANPFKLPPPLTTEQSLDKHKIVGFHAGCYLIIYSSLNGGWENIDPGSRERQTKSATQHTGRWETNTRGSEKRNFLTVPKLIELGAQPCRFGTGKSAPGERLRIIAAHAPMPAAVSQAFLAQTYALCMLILALNYLAAQLLMEWAQTANEFKARLTIQRANRIFVNVHENIPLHVAFLTGAMVITTGSGLETGLAYAIMVYTAARTAWLACYKGAPKPLDASNLLSVLYGTCLYTPVCAMFARANRPSVSPARCLITLCACAGASLLALLTGLLISLSAAFSGKTEAFGHTHRGREDQVL